ncbi:MAG: ParB N-terminal domain-containing protein [Candidatus Omnitrophica bacterium]|nr:ParB N-terminal domain-containing protein [Candidatus Omnitrophota bacterium]
MNIQTIPIHQISPAKYNPRVDLQPNDPEYQRIKQSILEFNCVELPVWNKRTETLVSGHQRLKVLKELGYKEVKVSVVDLAEEKEKALNIALNKIRGRWDEEKLASLLEELTQMPDFEVGLTGFEKPEISNLFDKFNEDKDGDDFDVEADVKNIEKPITQVGDLIDLGRHRIICGDSSDIVSLEKLFGGQKAAMLHTDPPYNVDYYGGNRPHGKARPKDCRHWQKIYADNMSQEQYEEWLNTILSNACAFLDEGAPAYIWNGHRQFGPMYHILTGLDFHISSVITWAKQNFAIGYGDYNQQTEFCLYGWKRNNGTHRWYGPTNESTLWDIKRDPTSSYIHPTQKPIGLAQRAIRNSSVRGDIVFDLFLGSGSTLIASESLDRVCYGIEIDPKYCDAIVRRYIFYVGKDNVSSALCNKYLGGAK